MDDISREAINLCVDAAQKNIARLDLALTVMQRENALLEQESAQNRSDAVYWEMCFKTWRKAFYDQHYRYSALCRDSSAELTAMRQELNELSRILERRS